MNIAGKCEPITDRLDSFVDAGFENMELYLTTEMLEDGPEDVIANCDASRANIASVHTPHLNFDTDTLAYHRIADDIAVALDATLVLDSFPIATRDLPKLIRPDTLNAPTFGYENNPGFSAFYTRVNQLEQGIPLVFDTAHMHMSESSYLDFVADIFTTYDKTMLPVVHLADGIETKDGLAFGTGTIDLPAIIKIMHVTEYAGTIVLEVDQSDQPAALDYVHTVLDSL